MHWNTICESKKQQNKTKVAFLLSPPGVFGSIETGQVSVFFDDIHLFTGPKTQKESYHDWNFLKSKFFNFNKYKGQGKTCFKDVHLGISLG